jgi:hypothetical protein
MRPCVFVQPGSVPTSRSGLTPPSMALEWHDESRCHAPDTLALIKRHRMRHERNLETAS